MELLSRLRFRERSPWSLSSFGRLSIWSKLTKNVDSRERSQSSWHCEGRGLLPSTVSLWAGHSVEGSAEPRCEGAGGTFQSSPQAGADGEEAADGGKMRRRPGGRPGSGSVHSTTLATLAEQSQCQVGPTILFDHPPPGSPAPHRSDFPVGRPLCGVECRAEVRWVQAELFKPSPAVRYRR
jgi:hypothetical protein